MKTINTLIHKIQHLKPHQKWELAGVTILILLAAFTRFYRLEEFITFLGDQGRDTIVMKHIITGEHFPGIGPRSSVGQLFLGPFFYYLMAPFLLIFMMNPLGPAFGVALISTLALIGAYWILRKEVNLATAVLFIILAGFAYTTIWLSRFAWNPNLLPVFAFFTFYFATTMFKKKKGIHAFLFGALLAGAVQLHYLMLLTIPAILIMLIWEIIQERKHIPLIITRLSISAVGFGLILSPFIIFDIKNNFLNFRGILGLFTDKHLQSTTKYSDRLIAAATQLIHHVLQIEVPIWTGKALLFLIVLGTIWILFKKKPAFIAMNALSLLIFLFMFALVDADRYPHYYTPIYFSLFVFVSYFVGLISQKYIRWGVIAILAALFLWTNVPTYPIWQKEGNFQTHIAENIADTIIRTGVESPFYLVSVPFANTNDHIRYYLEMKNHRPLPDDTTEMAKDLVILCYDKSPKGCDVMNEAQYLVVHFGDRKIAKLVHHPEVTIYRLIHAK